MSAAIEQDSVVGLIGTNGAGKTTFINMITGYLKPDRGTHRSTRAATSRACRRARSRDWASAARSRSRSSTARSRVLDNMMIGLGIVLRNAGLGRLLLARRRAGARRCGKPAEEVAEHILGRFGLVDYRDRNAQVLPGGARKLLDIALTMVAKPRMLLLDEPTSGVSAQEKFGIMQMVLEAVRAEGATVLFVEHDMEVVSRFAQRVLAFYDGRIIADAPPAGRACGSRSEAHVWAATGRTRA